MALEMDQVQAGDVSEGLDLPGSRTRTLGPERSTS